MKRQRAFLPQGAVTGIGSLPFTDPRYAVQLIARICPDIPFWPQLPGRSVHEYMIEQALGDYISFFTARQAGYGYQILPGKKAECLQDLCSAEVGFSVETASGFFSFEQALADGQFKRAQAIKGQCIGPITLACQLFADEKQPFLFDQECLQAIGQYVTRLALWQTRRLQQWGLPTLCFLDEPCLALLSTAFYQPIAKQAYQELQNTVAMLQAEGVLVGIHCCAEQTSFAAMCQMSPDIISFDAYQSLDVFCTDQAMQQFAQDGGLIAFGLVPTVTDASLLDTQQLFLRWLQACSMVGNERQLAAHAMITATCGLGLLGPIQAISTFRATQQIADLVHMVALSHS